MNYVIIVGGGSGSRMGTDTPKQFLLLHGMPVIMHSMYAFSRCRYAPKIIAVIPAAQHAYWKDLCEKYDFKIPHDLVDGGKTRFESVKNGLEAIKSTCKDLANSVIAVHDAARPLVTIDAIETTFDQAWRTGAAALALPSTNSIRITSSNGLKNNAFPRHQVYVMQTPQTFRGNILSASYEQADDNLFTDDASVVERKGYPIVLVDGDTRNIKITFPEDLQIATILADIHSGSTQTS